MTEVEVEQAFAAPVDAVFAHLADHEAFLSGKGLRCTLTVPGEGERNGLNAIREVRAGALRFVERITAFDPPNRFDYFIESLRFAGLPIGFRHEGGELRMIPTADGTKVVWRTRFEVFLPFLGGPLEVQFAKRIRNSFAALLRRAADTLATSAAE